MLVLTVIQGPDKGRTFQLPDHEPQLIGRSSEALPISDTAVSRRHAELTPDDGLWFIRDLNSQNGTYVNGQRIAERTRLRAGDQIRVGSSLFVFGATDSRDPDLVRFLQPDQIDANVERAIPSNEDSMILAEPEPRAAAAEHLRVIYQLTQLFSTAAVDRVELLTRVLELVFNEFKPERGFILMAGEGADKSLRPAAVKYQTPPRDADDAKINVSRTIIEHVLTQAEGVLSSNAMHDPRFAAGDSVQRLRIRSAICSPIKFRERTYGVVYIDSSIANYTFTSDQLALLNAIAQHTGLTLANADLYAQKLHGERLAAMGEAVASLSHSIKNILQGLRGGADVVEMGLKKDDLKIAKGGWPILKRNLDRIVGLTMNMLTYSRQRRVELELVKLQPLIDDCVQLLEGQLEAKGVAVLVDVDPEIPPVALDPNLMHQALMNLIGNAVEAVEARKGAVTIRAFYHQRGVPASVLRLVPSARTAPSAPPQLASAAPARPDPLKSGAVLELQVIDNGAGVASENRAWIFEPFNTTKGSRGTGLGLAVARRIVEDHHGALVLDPASDRGATFRILLPADTAIDPSETTASRQERDPLTGEKR
ncbi:MAG: FHA domain-containing protein [Planctomycetota bacterium]|nr:FHA domain-containing protein [Planctomycetota bacterium]